MEKNSLVLNLTDSKSLKHSTTHLVALLPQFIVKLVKVIVIGLYKQLGKRFMRLYVALENMLSYKNRIKDDFYFHVSDRRGNIPKRVWNRYSALIVHWQLEKEESSPKMHDTAEALVHVQNSIL